MPGFAPRIPGSTGLYPLPRSSTANFSAWRHSFPLWKVRAEGQSPQQAMFNMANNLSSDAFYIAADDWTLPKSC
jgi:hypothetical protein